MPGQKSGKGKEVYMSGNKQVKIMRRRIFIDRLNYYLTCQWQLLRYASEINAKKDIDQNTVKR